MLYYTVHALVSAHCEGQLTEFFFTALPHSVPVIAIVYCVYMGSFSRCPDRSDVDRLLSLSLLNPTVVLQVSAPTQLCGNGLPLSLLWWYHVITLAGCLQISPADVRDLCNDITGLQCEVTLSFPLFKVNICMHVHFLIIQNSISISCIHIHTPLRERGRGCLARLYPQLTSHKNVCSSLKLLLKSEHAAFLHDINHF